MSTAEVIDMETGEVKSTAVTRMSAHQLASRELVGGMLRPVASPELVLEAQNEVRALVARTLTEGRDYGKIPGTDKPTLLKPGAERINAAYGLSAEYHIVEKEIDHDRPVTWTKRKKKWTNKYAGDRDFTWEEESGVSHGLYRYVIECRLIHRASGIVVGQGVGSCSTMESKYIDRPRDMENTVIKMAGKRGYVAVTLNTHGLSDQFTQDIEDNPEAFGLGKEQNGERLPLCPKCGKDCWDNRPKKAKGEYAPTSPDFACKDKKCGGKIWSSKDEGVIEAEELDRLADGVRIMVKDIRAIDSEQGDAAQKMLDELVAKEGVKASEISSLGGKLVARLRTLEEAKAEARTYDDEPPGFPDEDDELPFT